jgi:isopentenyl-diphosphate delta-isomerase
MEKVILVDELDNEVGTMEKLEAHRKGRLHRAFSIVVFNSKREILLQKRAKTKYHSGGLWTNACCSHPQPNESMAEATARKLRQEMGIAPQLKFSFKFIYQARLESNLVEHECDHVFTGLFDGEPVVNAEEVEDWRFVNLVSLKKDISENPTSYTYWFPLILSHRELVIGDR